MSWIFVLLILGVLGAVAVFFLVKSIWKAILYAAATLSGALLLISIVVYADAQQLNKNFFSQPNLFLTQENGIFYAGMAGRVEETPTYLTKDRLSSVEQLYTGRDLAAMRGENYRLFVFQPMAFADLQQEFRFGDVYLNKDEAITLLRSNNALQHFAELTISKQGTVQDRNAAAAGIMARFENQEELKAMLLSALIAQGTRERGNKFVPQVYRTKLLEVYPTSSYFTFISSTPHFLYTLMIR